MSVHQHASDGNAPTDDIRDAAWNAVAVASIHWQQSVNALRSVVSSAHRHGLPITDIALAGGIDEDHVVWLLQGVN